MKFDDMLTLLRPVGFFDLPAATQICQINPASLKLQISRWVKAGKLIPLRRGMYAEKN